MHKEINYEFMRRKKYCAIKMSKASDMESRFNVKVSTDIQHCDPCRKNTTQVDVKSVGGTILCIIRTLEFSHAFTTTFVPLSSLSGRNPDLTISQSELAKRFR